jgi:hypothetical protein
VRSQSYQSADCCQRDELHTNRWHVGNGCKLHLAVGCPPKHEKAKTNESSLIEMWMGIICTCLPAMHTFIRKVTGKHHPQAPANFPVVRDPNSDQIDPNVLSDSGYHSGQITGITLDTIDVESQHESVAQSVRPVASDKNLLVTTSRCDD